MKHLRFYTSLAIISFLLFMAGCQSNHDAAARGDADTVRASDSEAPKQNRQEAERGNPEAQMRLYAAYNTGKAVTKDTAEANKWLGKAIEQNYAPAQFAMGIQYDYGVRGPKDERQAMIWYRKAAEQGHSAAQMMLGSKYVKKAFYDPPQAVTWFRKSAEQGNGTSQYLLALMYAECTDIERDFVEAYAWAEVVAKSEDVEAVKNHKNAVELRQSMEKKLSPDRLVEAKERAAKLRALVADLTRDKKAFHGNN